MLKTMIEDSKRALKIVSRLTLVTLKISDASISRAAATKRTVASSSIALATATSPKPANRPNSPGAKSSLGIAMPNRAIPTAVRIQNR